MSVADEAAAALPAVWNAMVSLAEAGNDKVVWSQRKAKRRDAAGITQIASDLSTLARAAEVLARLRDQS